MHRAEHVLVAGFAELSPKSPLIFAHAKTVESMIASEHGFQDGKQQTNKKRVKETQEETQ